MTCRNLVTILKSFPLFFQGPSFTGLDSPGPIRSLAAIGDGMTVVCGFDSGLMSAVELRSGQIVALWRAHSDAVSQVTIFAFTFRVIS
ncbi:unnamed protein product [Dibothriocephalus latus]|uniref:Uncharacterized protein n=1 Tax=Dibothriocephalus latus TaxID=60516 RepID=A0A3P7QZY2_DIBLA|nr:unnamed protein product [Dibothriocephalus latus]